MDIMISITLNEWLGMFLRLLFMLRDTILPHPAGPDRVFQAVRQSD
jgi:hypothetical protein